MLQKRIIQIFFIIFLFLGGALPAFAAKDYNIKNDTESFFFVSGTSGNIGIATTAPIGKLEVRGGPSAASRIVNINGSFADLGGSRTGLYVDVTAPVVGAFGATGTWSQVRTTAAAGTYSSAISGAYTEAMHEGTSTVSNLMGLMTLANQLNNGPVTNAYGIYPQIWKGTGTVSNAYGMYFQGVPTANGDTGLTTGTLINQYGLGIGHLTTGTTRNIALLLDDDTLGSATAGDFGILQEDTAPNAFGGNIGVGTVVVDAQLTLHSTGAALVDKHWNEDITAAAANESQYYVGQAGSNRATPGDVQKFRFFAGYGAFQEVGQIAVNTPTATGGNMIGAVDIYTQGAAGTLVKRMSLDEQKAMFANNVGLGTTAPAARLHVGDAGNTPSAMSSTGNDAYIKGNLEVDGRIYGDGSGLTGVSGAVSGLTATRVPVASSSTTLADSVIYSVGSNVGIGSASPDQRLRVDGLIRATAVISSGVGTHPTGIGPYVETYVYNGDTGRLFAYNGVSYYDLAIGDWNGGNPNIMLKVGGNVGIGSGTPRNRLSVAGGADFSGNVGVGSTAPVAKLDVDGTVYFHGNVGIGTPIAALARLQVTGPAKFGSINASPSIGYDPSETYTGLWQIISSNIHGDQTMGSNLAVKSDQLLYTLNNHGSMTGAAISFGGNGHPNGTNSINFFAQVPGAATAGTAIPMSQAVMSIQGGGNVGMGTVFPAAKLHVGGGGSIPNAMPVAGGDDAYIVGNLEVDGKIYGDGSALTGINAISGLTDNYITRANGTSAIENSLIYDNATNIGIGTTAPRAKFHVIGEPASNFIALFAENGITPQVSSAAASTGRMVSVQGNGAAYFMGRDVTNNIEFIMGTSSTGAAFSGSMTSHSYFLRTGNVTRTTIDTSGNLTQTGAITVQGTGNSSVAGNLGIGTTAPVARLHVGAGAPSMTLSPALGASDALVKGRLEVDNTIYVNGNLGIGTTSPGRMLEIVGGNGNQFKITAGNTAWHTSMYLDSSNPFGEWEIAAEGTASSLPNAFRIFNVDTGGIAYFTISSGGNIAMSYLDPGTARLAVNGNVGIGTTAPLALLQVGFNPNIPAGSLPAEAIKGNLVVDGKIYGDGSGLTGVSGAITGLTATRVPVASGPTTIVDSGIYYVGSNVGIGSTAPRRKLEVVGSIEIGTTFSADMGVIYKGGLPFIHNFQHPTGDTAVPVGNNTFIGEEAGNFTMGSTATSSTHASYNLGIGRESLAFNTTGSYNAAIGQQALYANNSGSSNMALGSSALYGNQTGNYNVALGRDAGHYIVGSATNNTTSDHSLFLGYNTRSLTNNDQNSIVIGSQAEGLGSDTVVLGNTSIVLTALRGNVGIGTTAPVAGLHVGGSGAVPNAMPVAGGDDVYIAGNLEVDGKIYGDGSGLTGISGAITGLTATRVPVASGSTTIVDSNIYQVGGNIGIGTSVPLAGLTVSMLDDGANVDLMAFNRRTDSPADGDSYNIVFNHTNASGVMRSFAEMILTATDVANGSEDGRLSWGTVVNGTMTENASLTNSTFYVHTGDIYVDDTASFYAFASGDTTSNYTYTRLTSSGIYKESGGGDSPSALSLFSQGAGIVVAPTSGNVGIGTVTPLAKLHILNQVVMNGNSYDSLIIDGTDGNYGGQWIAGHWHNGFQGRIGFFGTNTTNETRGVALIGGTATTPDLFVNGNGNVGIGTTVPLRPLTVQAASGVDNVSWRNPSYELGALGYTGPGNNAGWMALRVDGTAAVELRAAGISYLNGGNLGIGTTVPAAALAVGTGTPNAMPVAGGDDVYIAGNLEVDGKIYGDGSALTGLSGTISGLTDNYLTRANGTTAIEDSIIYDSGTNIGIGTSTVLSKLHVASGRIRQDAPTGLSGFLLVNGSNLSSTTGINPGIDIFHDASNIYGFNLGYTSETSRYNNQVVFPTHADYAISTHVTMTLPTQQSDFTTRLLVRGDTGNVGIGTTTPVKKLEVRGGDVYINQVSSQLIMKKPDGTCASCGPNNSDIWVCTGIACP